MAVSKVVYDNKTIIDLTGDTVTRSTLAYGTTAHNAAGNKIIGSLILDGSEMDTSDFVRNGGNEDVVLNGENITIKKDALLTTETITQSFNTSVESNETYTQTLSVTKSGWTPIGIVGWSCSSTLLTVTRVYLSNSGAVFAGRNVKNQAVSNYTLRAQVLYLRTGS